jgi:HPt (histidine-containing phosphotransfer) domain-containing protein
MSVDLSRLAQLQDVLGESAAEIVEGLRDSMRAAIARIEASVAAGELAEAARAAHLCRNDALMVGAKQLLRALEAVEQASLAADPEAVQAALTELRSTWPATLAELDSAVRST